MKEKMGVISSETDRELFCIITYILYIFPRLFNQSSVFTFVTLTICDCDWHFSVFIGVRMQYFFFSFPSGEKFGEAHLHDFT